MALYHTSEELINRTAALLGKFVPGEALGAVEHDMTASIAALDSVMPLAELSKDRWHRSTRSRCRTSISRQRRRLAKCAIWRAADFSNQPLDLRAVDQARKALVMVYLVSQTPTYEVLPDGLLLMADRADARS